MSRELDLGAKVAALRQPETYPDRPGQVIARETHKSWVFLTESYAYKLKKPIKFNAVDFSSLEARRVNCFEEVRLNRRLAGDVYVGVVPLVITGQGTMKIGGEGTAVEWLVQMQRLPEERMLDHLIDNGQVSEQAIRDIAVKLGKFYAASDPVSMTPNEYRAHLAYEIQLNFGALQRIDTGTSIPAEGARQCNGLLRDWLESHSSLFDRRVSDGRIIEYHGDLRPEHVCLLDTGPVFFDCLEFDRRLRLGDPVDELGFLAMECERRGMPWVETVLLAEYCRISDDAVTEWLISFYQGYRAAMWARLAIWRLREPGVDTPKWLSRANAYLRLVDTYTRALSAATG